MQARNRRKQLNVTKFLLSLLAVSELKTQTKDSSVKLHRLKIKSLKSWDLNPLMNSEKAQGILIS